MRSLTPLPRPVIVVLVPRTVAMAVRIADLPLPLWPTIKLTFGPKLSYEKFLWFIKLTMRTDLMTPDWGTTYPVSALPCLSHIIVPAVLSPDTLKGLDILALVRPVDIILVIGGIPLDLRV